MIKDILKFTGFLIFIRYCFDKVLIVGGICLFLFMFFIEIITKPFYIINKENLFLELIVNLSIALVGIIVYISTLYFCAKIFGIFKFLEKYKLWIEILGIVIISVIMYFFLQYTSPMPQGAAPAYTLKEHIQDVTTPATSFYLAWLLRKFFNFLTKKFPTPFKQIGYFFSIEFYKDLCKKIINKSKPSD